LGVGWVSSWARNKWLLWKDRLGRLQWFETGRINLMFVGLLVSERPISLSATGSVSRD
jgi:hypothetical protein